MSLTNWARVVTLFVVGLCKGEGILDYVEHLDLILMFGNTTTAHCRVSVFKRRFGLCPYKLSVAESLKQLYWPAQLNVFHMEKRYRNKIMMIMMMMMIIIIKGGKTPSFCTL